MLRRAENVAVTHRPGALSSKGYVFVQVGKQVVQSGRKMAAAEFAHFKAQQAEYPVRWARLGDRTYYEFQGKFYWDNDDLTPEQVYALLVSRLQAQQRRVDRAQSMLVLGDSRPQNARAHISDDVKQFVFHRDGGACRHCGAVHELQYDHIISVAMGGSSEPENLQILCGPCNRRKGAGLTIRTHATSNTAPTSQVAASPLPPAGWYANPSGSGRRYWDGAAWTEHVSP